MGEVQPERGSVVVVVVGGELSSVTPRTPLSGKTERCVLEDERIRMSTSSPRWQAREPMSRPPGFLLQARCREGRISQPLAPSTPHHQPRGALLVGVKQAASHACLLAQPLDSGPGSERQLDELRLGV